jgi:hypothetical protein
MTVLRYVTREGEPVTGASAADVVIALRAMSRSPGRDLADYMGSTSARARLQNGSVVRGDTCAHFLADLVAAGLLERMN